MGLKVLFKYVTGRRHYFIHSIPEILRELYGAYSTFHTQSLETKMTDSK